jgi:hypothetical protein
MTGRIGGSSPGVRRTIDQRLALSAAETAWSVGVRSERNLGSPPIGHIAVTKDLEVGRW